MKYIEDENFWDLYEVKTELNPKIKDLYDRMIKLWGQLSLNNFLDILEEEGYEDLKTRIKITEELYDYLEFRYSGLDHTWRSKLKNMKDGFDRGLEYRIQRHKRLKQQYKKEVK